ncbi:MAG: phosphoribosylformylglycinamidine cyclo-ligase [Acidimicrobiia bacterium]
MASYRDAGVDLEGAEDHVHNIAAAVTATWSEEVVGGFGGFAAGVTLPQGYADPVLMLSTDGVGTKLELARRAGRWNGVGYDLVAMGVDDLAAMGARAVAFVDYLAVGALNAERDAAIVASIAAACGEIGCSLLGGETAVHPGVMAPDAVDLAGTALGVVERGKELGPHRVGEGDVVVGLRSPNLRSNGFSLVRAALGDRVDDHLEVLLEPSVIYSPAVLEAVAAGGVHAAAHITGGGIAANLARSLPEGLGASVDTGVWEPPAIFSLVANAGVKDEEMFRTFNMGIGFALVVDPGAVNRIADVVSHHNPVILGTVSPGEGVRLA